MVWLIILMVSTNLAPGFFVPSGHPACAAATPPPRRASTEPFWKPSDSMQSLLAPSKINFLPAHPKVAPDPDLAAVLKQAKIIEIDDRWAGDNRKRIIDRWVAEVLNAG